MNNFFWPKRDTWKTFALLPTLLLGLRYSFRVKPLGKQTLTLIFMVCPSESWGVLRAYLDPKEED